jgi:WD40 repeat protein
MRLTTLLPRFGLLIVCLFLANVTGKMQGEEFDTSLSVMTSGVHWSPDNRFIAVGTYNGLYIHDGATLKVVDYIALGYSVTAIAWHPGGDYIAFGTGDGEVMILNDNYNLWQQLPKHSDSVTDMRWSPNGEYLASKSNNDFAVWHLPPQQPSLFIEFEIINIYPSFALTWDKDSRAVAIHMGKEITIWDVETGLSIASFGTWRESEIIEWSPDNQSIAIGMGFGEIAFYSTADYEYTETFDPGYSDLMAMDWRNDGKYFATLGQPGGESSKSVVRIWRPNDRALINELPVGLATPASYMYYHSLEWSMDGTRLACATDDGKIFIWETEHFSNVAEYDGYLSGFLEGAK